MKIWKVILATLVIFVAGMVAGMMFTRSSLRIQQQERRTLFREREALAGRIPQPDTNVITNHTNREPLIFPYASRPPGRGMGKEFLDRLERELKIDPEQRKRLDKILGDSQKRSKEIWERIAPELKDEMKKSREQMREVLSADQNKRLDELMKKPAKPSKSGQVTNNQTASSTELLSNAPPASGNTR